MHFKTGNPSEDLSLLASKSEAILRQFGPYRDDIGLYHDRKTAGESGTEPLGTHGCGNALLYTSHVAIALWIHGARSIKGWRTFYENAMAGVRRCEVTSGIYRRHPVHYCRDQESHDDYVGLATLSSFGGSSVAAMIARRGAQKVAVCIPIKVWRWTIKINLNLPWYLPNAAEFDPALGGKFGMSAWLGRFVPMVTHVRACAGLSTKWWQRLAWSLAVATSGVKNPKRNDVWILPWNMCMAQRTFSPMEAKARDYFFKRLKKHWGDKPMSQVFRAYFAKHHPLCEWADGE